MLYIYKIKISVCSQYKDCFKINTFEHEQKMAEAELQEFNSSLSNQREAELSQSSRKRGGWITFPFLTGIYISFTH